MLKRARPLAIATLGFVALAGSGEAQAPDNTLYVRHAMVQEVNPAMSVIWDIGNASLTEDGGIDPSQMDDAKWTAIAQAATRLEATGRTMQAATTLKAAAANNMATEQFDVPMSAVQAKLDADPDGFREAAKGFADHAAALAAAASAHNEIAASELIAQSDTVCAACHAQYWYAQ